MLQRAVRCRDVLQRVLVATRCNVLQRRVLWCTVFAARCRSVLQHAMPRCNALYAVAARSTVLQHVRCALLLCQVIECRGAAADPLCMDPRTQAAALHLFVAHHVVTNLDRTFI